MYSCRFVTEEKTFALIWPNTDLTEHSQIRRFFSLDAFNPLALTSAEKKWAYQKGIDKAKVSDGEEKLV